MLTLPITGEGTGVKIQAAMQHRIKVNKTSITSFIKHCSTKSPKYSTGRVVFYLRKKQMAQQNFNKCEGRPGKS
jgi:hypothetical protein